MQSLAAQAFPRSCLVRRDDGLAAAFDAFACWVLSMGAEMLACGPSCARRKDFWYEVFLLSFT